MKSISRSVTSNQLTVHDNLATVVNKHLNSEFKKPIAAHTTDAYQAAIALVNKRKLILDSGCGNGKSTLTIANQYPDAFVIGIDKSSYRIGKLSSHNQSEAATQNYTIIRADLIDFWRLAANDNLQLHRHFILYPNPWPKKHHLKRRWHGSPVFKQLLKLGGQLELRSNWPIYINEFAQALTLAGFDSRSSKISMQQNNGITDFETKYHLSGQTLWQLTANLDISSNIKV
jgi:tRNA G46 methylase TrmB